MRLNLFFILAASLLSAAAPPAIGPAVLGYVYDPRLRSLRSIRGVPGAAMLSDPLDAGFQLAAAAVAPLHDYAIATSADSRSVYVLRWSGGSASPVALPDALEDPDRIVFSSSGTVALLYKEDSGRLQRITGLPSAPVVRDLETLQGAAAVAVADDGTAALASADLVRIVPPDLSGYALPVADARVIAFDRSGRLLAVTRSGDAYLASRPAAGLDVVLVFPAAPETADPVAAQFLPGNLAAVASTSGAVTAIDLDARSGRSFLCECLPTAFDPFGRPGLYRLTGISQRPVILFETAPDVPPFWFVPAEPPRSVHK